MLSCTGRHMSLSSLTLERAVCSFVNKSYDASRNGTCPEVIAQFLVGYTFEDQGGGRNDSTGAAAGPRHLGGRAGQMEPARPAQGRRPGVALVGLAALVAAQRGDDHGQVGAIAEVVALAVRLAVAVHELGARAERSVIL